MSAFSIALFGLMLAASSMAQKDSVRASSGGGSKALQPWLLGLTAMVVFLFIVFVMMIVNKLWCTKKKNEYNEEAAEKERAEMNVYTNDALEEEEEKKEEQKEKVKAKLDEEPKVTAM
ncbi:small integral membrane protein 24 [Discoglossus pictus]